MSVLSGLRILLVEDEYIVAETTAETLREFGAEVVGPASRLASGLALGRSERIDAAVLDINLNGERSDAIADLLRARGIPYILATGYGALAAGLDARVPVIDKPYTDEMLHAALARALSGAGRA